MNESEKREVEEDFWKFMRDSIWYCARNVTRSASAAERRNSGISLESLSEGSLRDYIAVENSHELGEEIEMIIRNIRFAIKSDGFGDVFDNLTERCILRRRVAAGALRVATRRYEWPALIRLLYVQS